MILISEAIEIIRRETAPLKAEKVILARAAGRVLAENIVSDSDLPPFDRSQMDGYAVRAEDTFNTPVRLKIVGESAAGRGWHRELKPGQAVRIMTGAPIPKGADAVQKLEEANEDGNFVEILEPTKPGKFIVARGEEVKNGETVFGIGELLNANMPATLASFGYAKVKVFKQPALGILVTGSEIVPAGKIPKRDQIRDSNSTLLRGYAQKCGANVTVFPPVGDDPGKLKKAILKAAKSCDALVISGGVSVGKYDFTKTALHELGAEIFFEKLSLKPGKPMVFARLNSRLGKTLVFGLPGNPVSVSVTFNLFVRTALMLMQSANEPELKMGHAVATAKIKGAQERDSMLPARVATNDRGQLAVESLRFTSSSNFIAFAHANALVYVPQGKTLEKGDIAEIHFL
jgi:molybdopterin molybdotransferase